MSHPILKRNLLTVSVLLAGVWAPQATAQLFEELRRESAALETECLALERSVRLAEEAPTDSRQLQAEASGFDPYVFQASALLTARMAPNSPVTAFMVSRIGPMDE